MTSVSLMLREGEDLVGSSDELIFRQIAPHMLVDEGRVSTIAFGPNTSDNGMPSYSRESVVTAQEARDWHTAHASSKSFGVFGVTVNEVIESGRYVVDDSRCSIANGAIRAPGHCFVDFRRLARAERKELRARLFMHAMKRGEIPTVDSSGPIALFE